MTSTPPVAPGPGPDPPPGLNAALVAADPPDPRDRVHDAVLRWYAGHGRDLPWRRPECSPWGVFVSEIMAQQTPISRILEPWTAWLARWPAPADLAAAAPAEAIVAWARLGYPRRALHLHAAAVAMVERHDGQVPDDPAALRALPGVGDYTAAAVASFAFGRPEVVVDTNVRRVLARIATGQAQAAPSLTAAERALAARWQPADVPRANAWNVASMELGALVCTARAPACHRCPARTWCRWLGAGRPAYDGPRRKPPGHAGTDREIRGLLLGRVREAAGPVPAAELLALPGDPDRGRRCLESLVADGLLVAREAGYDLPR